MLKHQDTIFGILLALLVAASPFAEAQDKRMKPYAHKGTIESIDFDNRSLVLDFRGKMIDIRLAQNPRMVWVHKVQIDEIQPGDLVETVLTKPMASGEANVGRVKKLEEAYKNRPRIKGRVMVGTVQSIGDTLVVEAEGETAEAPITPNTIFFKETVATQDDYKPGMEIVVKGRSNGEVYSGGQLRLMADNAEEGEDEVMDEEDDAVEE